MSASQVKALDHLPETDFIGFAIEFPMLLLLFLWTFSTASPFPAFQAGTYENVFVNLEVFLVLFPILGLFSLVRAMTMDSEGLARNAAAYAPGAGVIVKISQFNSRQAARKRARRLYKTENIHG